MVNVLLLGDSIRMGYQAEVAKCLGADYKVSAPQENSRFSMNTLCLITAEWLPTVPKPDIIHWNNGLWDAFRRYPEDGCFTPIDEYLRNMERILRELRRTGAKIIFATTTPTMMKEPDKVGSIWRNEDIIYYNKRVIEHIGDKLDAVNDLYKLMLPKMSVYLRDFVHYNEIGNAALGQAVADAIVKMNGKQIFNNRKK